MFKVMNRRPEMEDVSAAAEGDNGMGAQQGQGKLKAPESASKGDVEAGAGNGGTHHIVPYVDPKTQRVGELTTVRGEVELQHVAFAYPARPDVMIFQ